jgi:phage baseplate assembly protein gpV
MRKIPWIFSRFAIASLVATSATVTHVGSRKKGWIRWLQSTMRSVQSYSPIMVLEESAVLCTHPAAAAGLRTVHLATSPTPQRRTQSCMPREGYKSVASQIVTI